MDIFTILVVLSVEKVNVLQELDKTLQELKEPPSQPSFEPTPTSYALKIINTKLLAIAKIEEKVMNINHLISQSFSFNTSQALDSSTALLAASAKDYNTAYNMAFYLSHLREVQNAEDDIKNSKMSKEAKDNTLKQLQFYEHTFWVLACSVVGYDASKTSVPYVFPKIEDNLGNIVMAFELSYNLELENKIQEALKNTEIDLNLWDFGRKKTTKLS